MNIFALDMEQQVDTTLRRRGNIFIHALIWSIVFVIPIVFAQREGLFRWREILQFFPLSIAFTVVFYTNYFYLVDKLLFKKKITGFILLNIAIIAALALLLHVWHEIEHILSQPSLRKPPPDAPQMPVILFVIRDMFSLIFMAALGTVMKTTERIGFMQSKQKEMEKAMTEAELKNLKNQINPHFLLNTLNNIYALSQFNSPQTSPAIMQLSELLRHLLYENEKMFVPLRDEADFISNYIDLMKLRLTDNVKVTSIIRIPEGSTTQIAPLIYISLIENAFKHGVSNDEASFIEMELTEQEDGNVYFVCRNSCFPKSDSDRSGSGIGLQQVQKRLDLLYPYRYMWRNEINDNVYSTILIINTFEK